MAEKTGLTYDEYLVMAMLAGIDADEEHLQALYGEVAPMFDRIELLRSVDASPDAPLAAPEAVSEL